MNIYYIGSMDDGPSAGRGNGKRERPIDTYIFIEEWLTKKNQANGMIIFSS